MTSRLHARIFLHAANCVGARSTVLRHAIVGVVILIASVNAFSQFYVNDDWWVIDHRRPLSFAVSHNDSGDVYFEVTSQAAHGVATWKGAFSVPAVPPRQYPLRIYVDSS